VPHHNLRKPCCFAKVPDGFQTSSSPSIGPRWLVPPEVLQPCRLIVRAQLWKFLLPPPGSPTPMMMRKTSSRERGNYGPEISSNFTDKLRVVRNLKGSFTCCKSVTWDRQLYFPSEGRHAEDFFCPEKSDGFGQV
jgi:hypothetical protein